MSEPMEQCNNGISFTQAILDKYFDISDYDGQVESRIQFPTFTGRFKPVNYSRFDKLHHQLKQYNNRTEIDIKNKFIDKAEIDAHIIGQFKNVYFLNLSFNLLTSWLEVGLIVDSFKSLTHLILNGNPLPAIISDDHVKMLFKKLTMIALGKMNYDWNQVITLSQQLWPQITYLDIFSNNIFVINKLHQAELVNLKVLILSENRIKNWKHICALGHLPNLEDLKLVDCFIDSIYFEKKFSELEKVPIFTKLRILDLKNNQLKEWMDIANLSKLISLQELTVKGNPLFENLSFDHAFNFVLAMIEGLKKLNRQEITSNLRKEGEIYYLRYHYNNWLKACEEKESEFTKCHPTYNHLLNVYGTPIGVATKVQFDPKQNFVQITIDNSLTGQSITKKLPKKTCISSLKVFVKRLFHINDIETIEFTVSSSESKMNQYPLEDDNKSLDFYSIKDGDHISFQISTSS